MMGTAPSLIRRVSSSAMPVLAFPWRMAAYMRSSFRLSWLATATHWRRRRSESTPRPAAVPLLGRWQQNLPSNLIWRKADRAPPGHAAAFLPLEHDCRPPQTAGTFLRPCPAERWGRVAAASLAETGLDPWRPKRGRASSAVGYSQRIFFR